MLCDAIYITFRSILVKTLAGTSQDGIIFEGVAVMSGRGFWGL